MTDAEALHWIENEPAFRGLWQSKIVNGNGSIEGGWSITFVFDGEYYDLSYQKSAVLAVVEARKQLGRLEAKAQEAN